MHCDDVSPSPRAAIECYLRAKDENRPFLMERAFAVDAVLEVVAAAGTIAFPPVTRGRDGIADILVRRFAQAYENVRTFCLAGAPPVDAAEFSCAWLVGMSEKESGRVRVGCGRYDWRFEHHTPRRADRLAITIRSMESIDPGHLAPVMAWLSSMPYPWCPAARALAGLPALAALDTVRAHLAQTPHFAMER
ncbi:MAG: hypothetical protein IT517_07230 [Burkholderiales bacterium]|nr:hypothetical protein [Burkholderiales bacterium]